MKVLDSKHLHHMWRSSTPSAKVKKSLATMESGEVEVIDTLSSVKYDIPLESKSSMLIKTIGRMSYL
eukprot:gene18426-21517_t